MTIEAGVLSLKITETGADQVLAKLGQIDAKARALGNATQGVRFNAPSMTGVSGQLAVVGAQMQTVTRATANLGAATAATGAAAVQSRRAHADLGQAVAGNALVFAKGAQSKETAAKQASILNGRLGTLLTSYLSFTAVVRVYDAITAAADRQDNAQRKLSAVSRLTGTELSTVTGLATQTRDAFKLSSANAAELTQGFVKLSTRAGDVTQAGTAMSAWMDLGAANGLTLSQTLQALDTTLAGNDEGLNRLGLMNPGQIWDKWATAVGGVKGQLTEQQKWMTIVMEVMTQGNKVGGEYLRWLDSAQGKQQVFNSELEKNAAIFGKAIEPIRIWGYEIGTATANALGKVITFFRGVDEERRKANAKMGIGEMMPQDFLWKGPRPLKSAAPIKVTAPPVTAADITAAKAAAKDAQETIAKALALDLDQMPLTDGIPDNERAKFDPSKPTVGVGKDGKMQGIAVAVGKQLDAVGEVISEKKQMLMGLMSDVAGSIGNAFGDAFSAAFSGEGNFFAEFGKSLLSSLGNILMQLGGQMIAYGAIIAPLASLLSFTPFGGLGMGAGASIAAGLAITALGAAMGAVSGGGSKGGGGGGAGGGRTQQPEQDEFSVAFDPDRKLRKSGPAVMPGSRGLSNAPMPEGRPVVQIGTINSLSPDDAKWQRAVADTYNNARNRGLVKRG